VKISERLDKIEERLNKINSELGQVLGSQKTTVILIKYVILPLIIILGGLVGIRIW